MSAAALAALGEAPRGGALAFPFLHPAWLGVGIVGALLAHQLWPRPWWAAPLAGLALAAAAALAGLVPWFGQLQLTGYAVLMLAGFFAAWRWAEARAARLGLPADSVREQVVIAAIAGILGARAWYVIEYRREFPSPLSDFGGWLSLAADLDRGGAVWFGGLLAATLALAVHARRRRLPPLAVADALAPPVLLGLAIGRIGCFINGCCYGAACACQLPWLVLRHGTPVHPTQLYETLACGSLALVLGRRPLRAAGSGRIAGWALIGYAAWRFVNETMRGDYADKLGAGFSLSPLHLTSAQWFALPLAALGAWLLWRARRHAASPCACGAHGAAPPAAEPAAGQGAAGAEAGPPR
ncbi:MAG: prolipoprotein diacylglyceryl transferase [Planctomycetota bacterium]|nr:prolipoprotein diacylglyceryl transferase [Planctomycetota bacterium]